MEDVIALAVQMCTHIPLEIGDLINRRAFVKRLVDVLEIKPTLKHPRIRRVIIEMVISLMMYPPYHAIFAQQGMMEALSTVDSMPSLSENRVTGLPMAEILRTAKNLITSREGNFSMNFIDNFTIAKSDSHVFVTM